MIDKVEIPCMCGTDERCSIHAIEVKEFAGKLVLNVNWLNEGTPTTLKIELNPDDLTRAWNAVKK